MRVRKKKKKKEKILTGLSSMGGCIQTYKDVEDFRKEKVGSGELHVGPGPMVYREWTGVADALVPVPTLSEEASVYVKKIDWSLLPGIGELSGLFHFFLKQYDREVLVVVGRSRTGEGHLYFVPEQTGTSGGVDWKADEDMDEFYQAARWVGTIHTHPQGMSSEASGIDVDEWADPKKSGLHIIFEQNGAFHVYLAVAERTIQILSSAVSGVPPSPVVLKTSRGRPLEELLSKPPPPRRLVEQRIPQRYQDYQDCQDEVDERWRDFDWEGEQESLLPDEEGMVQGYGPGWVLDDLMQSGDALMCVEDDPLYLVKFEGLYYVMTDENYYYLRETLKSGCLPAYYLGRAGSTRRVH